MKPNFTPLFCRVLNNYDRMMNNAAFGDPSKAETGVPCNIEKIDQLNYRITIAVPGLTAADIEVVARGDLLTVSGVSSKSPFKPGELLHRGLTSEPFNFAFVMDKHMVIKGADLNNGLLVIHLTVEVPEALKPRKIEITSLGLRSAA